MTAQEEYPKVTTEDYIKGIGHTPLLKLEAISNAINRNVYIKEEYDNSGTSIKDRAAYYLLQDALKSGELSPGGTLVEATAGNTGLSLALLGRTYDPPFKIVLFVPESLVQEKIDLLESLGAKVNKSPIVAQDHPEFFNNRAIRYAKEMPNSFHTDQMNNTSNRRAHFETTGPEIWEQLEGNIQGFVSSAGTGGTFAGVASFLKSKNPEIKTIIADPQGSGLYTYITTKGQSWESEGSSFVEGVGKKGLTGQLQDVLELADFAVRGNDTDIIITIYELLEQGINVGGSSGLNIIAAIELAKSLPEGSNVVTTAADHSDRYASKLFNKEYLIEHGHWDKIPEHIKKYATFQKK